MAGERSSRQQSWGRAFEWEIKGAGVAEVWAVTGDFLRVGKLWLKSIVDSCELVEGEAQQAGCVRKMVLSNMADLQPFEAIEKLLHMDELQHTYSYSLLHSTLPVLSLYQNYVSTFKLSPLPPSSFASPHHDDDQRIHGTLLHWSFICSPSSSMHEQDAYTTMFSLYQVAIDELKVCLSLPPGDGVSILNPSSV